MAVTEGPRIRNNLAAHGALTPDAIVVTFDWPSEFAQPNVIRDSNDKARLAFVGGFSPSQVPSGISRRHPHHPGRPQPWWTCLVICPSIPRGRDARHGRGGNRPEGGPARLFACGPWSSPQGATAIGSILEVGLTMRWLQAKAFYPFTTRLTRSLSSIRSDGIPINDALSASRA